MQQPFTRRLGITRRHTTLAVLGAGTRGPTCEGAVGGRGQVEH
jgi:hypothetical protein